MRKLRSVGLLAFLLIDTGCSHYNPNQGFTIQTQETIEPMSGVPAGSPPFQIPLEGMNVFGDYVGPAGSPTAGTANYYNNATDEDGKAWISDAITPGYWNHMVWLPPFCANPIPPAYYVGTTLGLGDEYEDDHVLMQNKDSFDWNCITQSNQTPEASSRFAYSGNIPSSVTLSALDPFSTTYGYPIMYVYDGANGTPNLYTTIMASSVASDGSSATFPLPSSMPQNAYFFSTANANSTGGFLPNSYNFYSVAGQQTITGSPFGVAASGQTTFVQHCIPMKIGPITHLQCSHSTTYQDFPVISLYSEGQVLVDNTPVNVGANPTAVAVYSAGAVVKEQSTTETIDVSGTTGAIVANSGSNTVSVLDIVNNDVKATITVGNQPVALAVSSDGSAAYVANYTDDTVSSINLTTDSVGETVAVGGHPTSVALTAAGVLWVGGTGFLTKINTSTMQVVATESTPGKSIASIGYSDEEGQIIATTVDGTGNVYSDQINPASVVQGGSYQPLASNLISTLGIHLDTRTNKYIQAYTKMLASAPALNAIQPGAPPLVVQDGWLVVTATPTGFAITDITGSVVLVSETTSSPVTAIAVDPKLNVAYLAMPDSNTVLEVPLPGTGD